MNHRDRDAPRITLRTRCTQDVLVDMVSKFWVCFANSLACGPLGGVMVPDDATELFCRAMMMVRHKAVTLN